MSLSLVCGIDAPDIVCYLCAFFEPFDLHGPMQIKVAKCLFQLFDGNDAEEEISRLKSQDAGF